MASWTVFQWITAIAAGLGGIGLVYTMIANRVNKTAAKTEASKTKETE